jgi:hypothetical protein
MALKITLPAGKAECPECGGEGFNGIEEDSGRPFTCYFCCETGLVPEQVAADYWRDRAWGAYLAAERAIEKRVALGVPAGYGYYYDPEEGDIVLVPPRRPATAAALARDNTMGDPCSLLAAKAELAAANKQACEAIAKATGVQA